MPTGRAGTGGSSVPGRNTDGAEDLERTGRAAETNDSPDPSASAWEFPTDAELGLPPVEIHPWGDHALAVIVRCGARVRDLRTALRFVPEDAVFEGVYGDVEFAVAFDVPHETTS